jgi:2-polyprenyl-3-methyl-5-hydroxy-6-metoxy-1,4-benzoquinol methylase
VTQFDSHYYRRFYRDPKTRVTDRRAADRLGNFVCSYLRYLELPVARALDLGCGLGHWQGALKRHYPRARYQGVEYSSYLCEKYGWEQGSVVDYQSDEPFDLVICQGVLPYLGAKEAKQALQNLADLCAGALYLEAITRDDLDAGVIDTKRTDKAMHLRSGSFYRRALKPYFEPIGGGVWLSKRASAVLYNLERA